MNDQARMKRNIILLLVGFLMFIIGTAVLINHEHKKSPGYTVNLVDRDTGEVLSTQPNQAVEGNAGGGGLTFFGSDQLLSAGATSAQFDLIKKDLATYDQTNLKNKYQTFSIIPSAFKANGGDLSGQLRLGQGNNIVNFEIKLSQLKFVQVIITDTSGQNGGNYDSGQMTVPADQATTSD